MNTYEVSLFVDGVLIKQIVDNAHSVGEAESAALALHDGAEVAPDLTLYMGATSDQTLLMGVG